MAQDDLGPDDSRSDEGRFAATHQNKAAGRALRAARRGQKQSDFAARLSQELGVAISPTTLSGWETGRRTVPAPVWIAAAITSSESLDALLGEAGAEEVEQWAESLGLLAGLQRHTQEIAELKSELQQLREEYADFSTQVIDSLARAGVPYPKPSSRAARRGEREESDRHAAGG